MELQGDEAYLRDAYKAIRDIIVRHAGAPLVTDPAVPVPSGPGRRALQVTITHDLYRRVHALERARAAQSQLFAHLDIAHIGELYVDRGARAALERRLPLGPPLWSELAPCPHHG